MTTLTRAELIERLRARFYLVGGNRVLQANLDLEEFAAELGAIEPWEALGDRELSWWPATGSSGSVCTSATNYSCCNRWDIDRAVVSKYVVVRRVWGRLLPFRH